MRCKTHIVAANTILLFAYSPKTPKELIVSLSVCTLGSIISDLDIRTSDVHKMIDGITIFSFITTLIAYLIDLKYNYGIFTTIKNGIMYLPIIGILLTLGITFYGSHQPHRSFLHSILGAALLTTIFYYCFGNIWKYFLVGILSHILLDLLNKKSIRLFYPSKKGYRLNLCEYGGLIDSIIFYSSIALITLQLYSI